MKISILFLTCLTLFAIPLFAGDINGKIILEGSAPKPVPISFADDPACATANKEPVMAEHVRVNANGTLQDVLVYIKDDFAGKKFPVPSTKAVLDQRGCVYTPHVMGVQTGQDVDILNSDPTLHNIHTTSKLNLQFNLAIPPHGTKITRQFNNVEIVPVKCDIHRWMSAFIGVFNHPFFAVSGNEGTFTIKDVPPGDYTLEAWQEIYGVQHQKVHVEAAGATTVDFKFKAK